MSLDDPDIEDEDVSAIPKLLPGRRAFSVDVQAGLELQGLELQALELQGSPVAA